MQNIKLYLCAATLILCAGTAFTATAADTTNNLAELPSRPDYHEWTVGAEAGSTGIGGFGSWRFYDHLGVRAGFDYFESSQRNPTIQAISYTTTLRLMSEPLTLDIYPWKKHSFHISAGWLFNQNELTGTASDYGTITIGGQQFPVPSVGTLNLKIQSQEVNPYLGIGGNFLYFDHGHHWALGGELGVAYTGDAKVSLTRSGPSGPLSGAIDAAVSREQNKAQDWANQLKWMPMVKLMVTYSF